MSGRATEDRLERWVIDWFPPDALVKTKRFDTEVAARAFASQTEIAEWHPIMTHEQTTVLSIEVEL